MGPGPRLGRPAVRQVVRQRHPQRVGQLRRPARRQRARRPGRDPLGGRARGRHPLDHLRGAAGRGLQDRQRADRPRCERRRPRRDLHADDPRDGLHDAGLRPHRRPAHGGVRRLLRGRAGQPDHRLRGARRGHRRRRLPPWCALGPQAGRRRGGGEVRRRGPQGPRRTPHRAGRRLGRHARRVVARRGGRRVDDARAEGVRLRAPALRDVHLRHHRQAQGHPAHHGWLPGRLGVHALGRLRPQARHRRLLVHRRHRLGHRAQLHGLRAAGQRARRR